MRLLLYDTRTGYHNRYAVGVMPLPYSRVCRIQQLQSTWREQQRTCIRTAIVNLAELKVQPAIVVL